MAKIYARRILRGDITIEDVPERLKAAVASILEEG